jgi:hypothetical protein
MNVSINFGLYAQSQGRVRKSCLIQTGIEIKDLAFRVSSIILWIIVMLREWFLWEGRKMQLVYTQTEKNTKQLNRFI